MRTGARFFMVSAAFAATIAGAYWFVTYEPAGTALLASLAVGALLVGAFVSRHAGDRRAPEDRPGAPPSAGVGRTFGPLLATSAWPALLGAGAMLFAAGLVYAPWLLIVGAVAVTAGLIGLARESQT